MDIYDRIEKFKKLYSDKGDYGPINCWVNYKSKVIYYRRPFDSYEKTKADMFIAYDSRCVDNTKWCEVSIEEMFKSHDMFGMRFL